jgi:hypothetical protein
LSDVLTMDESPTPAGLSDAEPGRPAHIKKGYFWALYGDKDEVA